MNVSIVIPALIILTFGVVNLIGIRPDLVMRYFILIGAGAGLSLLVYPFRNHFFRRNASLFYCIGVLVLVGTYILGVEVKGSTRWIDVFFFRFQPSEMIKLLLIIFLAQTFSSFKAHQSQGLLFLKVLVSTSIPFFCIVLQPDLGSALVFLSICIVMLAFSPISMKTLLTVAGICVVLSPLSWFFLHGYQKDRILSFTSSIAHSSKASYNMTQALITVGSGRLTGRGLGQGSQSTLSFLPEYHTDFAFSSLVEQFGFLGGFALILTYMVFLYTLVRYAVAYIDAKSPQSQYAFYYSIGYLSFVATQTIINMGMNVGILPITGITLPLISYGGSSLLVVILGLALLPSFHHD